jgi:NADH-quinone oxidoreductase subunit H
MTAEEYFDLWEFTDWLTSGIIWIITTILVWLVDGIIWILQGIVGWIADSLDYNGWFWDGAGMYWLNDLIGWFNWINDSPVLKDEAIMHVISALIAVILFFLWAFLNVLNFMWIERKLISYFWDMRGPRDAGKSIGLGTWGWIQQMADALKMFGKETIAPAKADKLLLVVSPAVFASSSLLIMAAVPLSGRFYVADLGLGIVFVLAVFSIAPIAVLAGGWASNNKYTLIGGMRSAAMLMAYEIPMILSILPVFLWAGSFNPFDIVQAQQDLGIWYGGPLFIGLITFIICLVCEAERIPFDLPEAEAELVEGWTTEFTGMRFGWVMFGEYIRTFMGLSIAAIVFLGGWSSPFPENIIPPMLWLLIKVYLIFMIFVWIRASLPRVRTDQILEFGWKTLLPMALVNLFIGIAIKTLGMV